MLPAKVLHRYPNLSHLTTKDLRHLAKDQNWLLKTNYNNKSLNKCEIPNTKSKFGGKQNREEELNGSKEETNRRLRKEEKRERRKWKVSTFLTDQCVVVDCSR